MGGPRHGLRLDPSEPAPSELTASRFSLFRWLAPLALDPLPRGTNLAAAVLARIYAAASAQGVDEPSRAGLLDPVGQLDHARTRLENLQATHRIVDELEVRT